VTAWKWKGEMSLNLYLVSRKDDVDYDETASYVVAASDSNNARGFGSHVSGDQPDSIWWAPTTSITLIGVAVPSLDVGIVHSDYKRG
jgi:hypothetical protein